MGGIVGQSKASDTSLITDCTVSNAKISGIEGEGTGAILGGNRIETVTKIENCTYNNNVEVIENKITE